MTNETTSNENATIVKLVKPCEDDELILQFYIDDEHSVNDGCQQNCGPC